jgi:ABC-type cobalamin/Fe3+-siderophores transport system ATPase subunit
MGLQGVKTYLHDKSTLLNTIYDIAELRNGDVLISDKIHGRVLIQYTMYGFVWTTLLAISETGRNKCQVTIRVEGERRNNEREIRQEFALLDSMLVEGVGVKFLDSG